ncbi:MAG TPA: CBS domain-containing protein [Steroidobacteraceae bacterium]
MTIGTICSRNVCVSRRGAALASAVENMTKSHVGAIVVVDNNGSGGLKPVGIITDRDVVCGQLSPPRDLFCMVVEDAMSSDIVTLQETCGVGEGVAAMSERGVRRAPVVDQAGTVVGIVSMDDLLSVLARDFTDLAALIRSQPGHES